MMAVQSPNVSVQPVSAAVNDLGHLTIGGVDVVELAKQFGTPLWIMDEQTILDAIAAYKAGLQGYPNCQILYAGKAFLCLAICHLLRKQGLGIDVVSPGELHTVARSKFPPHLVYMHGNNKSAQEIKDGLNYGEVRIVVDSASELKMVAAVAGELNKRAKILLRVIPGVEPETHQHIITGHAESKFGSSLAELPLLVKLALESDEQIQLLGLQAHIGSQGHEIEPFRQSANILADCALDLHKTFGLPVLELDVGGGLAIAYTDAEKPAPIFDWTKTVASEVQESFQRRSLPLPRLLIEPGRTIVGTAGITIYRAGHKKKLPSGLIYLAVDGGMADNPRPITYQARYSAAIANRMKAPPAATPITLAGKYCESGDIIIKEARLSAETGDLIAVFATGAYNYSMASNYNRTGRPACLLVSGGKAEIIIERETNEDLLRQDRVPERLRQ